MSAASTETPAPVATEAPLITTPAVEAQRQAAQTQSLTTDQPFSTGDVSGYGWGSYFQAIGILIALLLIFWYALRLIRKVGAGRFLPDGSGFSRKDVFLEAQLPVGRNRGLYVVRYLGKRLLLGVTDQQITLLDSGSSETKENAQHDERVIAEFQRLLEQEDLQVLRASAAADAVSAPADAPSAGSGSGGTGR